MKWCIYALVAPGTNEVRYVGWTINEARRLADHISTSRREETHKARWIRSLLRKGEKPEMHIIERGEGDSWAARERHWVTYFRVLGRLTNATDGGDGTPGAPCAPATRAKIGAANKGRRCPDHVREIHRRRMLGLKLSPERIERAAATHRGRKRPPETGEKIRAKAIGRRRSPEVVERIASLLRGRKHSPEQRERAAQGLRGKKKTPEHVAKFAATQRAMWRARVGLPTDDGAFFEAIAQLRARNIAGERIRDIAIGVGISRAQLCEQFRLLGVRSVTR